MPLVDIVPSPPAAPTITNDIQSVSVFLQNPAFVQARMMQLTDQKFVGDFIFSKGPAAPGGAVAYNQNTTNDLFLSRDVKPIAPGAEYPLLTDTIPTPLIALIRKWGGRIEIYDEDISRNRVDVLGRELNKLANTMVRKVDTVAIKALNDAVTQTYAFSTQWSSSSTDIISGLTQAQLIPELLDLPYELNTLIVNPTNRQQFFSSLAINKNLGLLAEEALVRTGFIGTILGFNIFVTNRVPAGTAYLVERGQVGSVSDEGAAGSKTYRQEDSDKVFVQAWRKFVPFVTDPLAAVKLTGL